MDMGITVAADKYGRSPLVWMARRRGIAGLSAANAAPDGAFVRIDAHSIPIGVFRNAGTVLGKPWANEVHA